MRMTVQKVKQRRGKRKVAHQTRSQADRERLKAQALELYQSTDMTQTEIAERIGSSQAQISLWVRGITRKIIKTAPGAYYKELGPKSFEDLDDDAKRGLEDFEFFRERYLGRSTPNFQKGANNLITGKVADRILFLWPPTFGKTSMVSVDYVIWRITQDRDIRILALSRTEPLAKDVIEEVKENLQYNTELIEAYGEFYNDRHWRQGRITVLGRKKFSKDPTLQSTSVGKHIVGRRCDLLIVDDICDGSNSALPENRDKLSKWFHEEAETRIEPDSGVCVIVGTRFSPHDLYAELKEATLDESEEKIWTTITFVAHDALKCDGETHTEYPDGCLLWPQRADYKYLMRQRSSMGSAKFDFIYQQMDVPADDVLVKPIWIYGGKDPHTGVEYDGCLDKQRGLWSLPERFQGILVAGIDPSVENWTVFELWGFSPEQGTWALVTIHRQQRMLGPSYTDKMEEWRLRCEGNLGRQINEWVVESVGAFKFLLQDPINKEWRQRTGSRVFPFETTITNKYDPEYGVTNLGPEYEFGRVRLPYGTPEARIAVQPIIDEATRYPHGATTDCLMAQWFPWNRRKKFKGGGGAGGPNVVGQPIEVGDYWNRRKGLTRVR